MARRLFSAAAVWIVFYASIRAAGAYTISISTTNVELPPDNAGMEIGDIATTPAQGNRAKLSLAGTDAAKFRLSTNRSPAKLLVGPASLPAGQYHVTINAWP